MRAVIACGGSGGHIFPGIALAQELTKKSGNEVLIICSNKPLDIQILGKSGFNFEVIPYNPFVRTFNPLKIVPFFKKFMIGSFLALRLLLRFRPHCAVGFGGFTSGPVIFAAWLIRVPRIIHEQNLIAGLASRVESLFADRVAVSFEDTKRFFNKKKVVKVGNPVRGSFLRLDKRLSKEGFGLDRDRFTILVIGGSQGASFLNNIVIGALKSVDPRDKSRLQVIHIAGIADCESVREGYARENIVSRVFSFLDEMDKAYTASDLVIGRAGATTIAELTYFGKASILVPYPKRSVHQTENAHFLSDNNAGVTLEEKDADTDRMRALILSFLSDAGRLEAISWNSKRLGNPDAGRLLAEEVSRSIRC